MRAASPVPYRRVVAACLSALRESRQAPNCQQCSQPRAVGLRAWSNPSCGCFLRVPHGPAIIVKTFMIVKTFWRYNLVITPKSLPDHERGQRWYPAFRANGTPAPRRACGDGMTGAQSAVSPVLLASRECDGGRGERSERRISSPFRPTPGRPWASRLRQRPCRPPPFGPAGRFDVGPVRPVIMCA